MLKRVIFEGGFWYFGGVNLYFDKELKELYEFRVWWSVEGLLCVYNYIKIMEEFEFKGDNYSVVFLYWVGKSSFVSFYVFYWN